MAVITVTRLDGREFVMNAELIETVEAVPDTVITLTTGKKFVVLESVADIVARVKEYKRSLVATSSQPGEEGPRRSPGGSAR